MMSDISQVAAPVERTVKQITLLMPVWGYQFIGRFLEFCLPTLLAPNNIPALAKALPCRFVLLSRLADEAIIRSHPAWQKLERLCTAEIASIDDLITQGNHTATITLAFERAVRQSGDAMRDTCFIFLMSDYLVADGSLGTVLRTVRNGAGAVLVGNFQVTAEDAMPLLRRHIDLASHEIVLAPRDLVRWSLAHLHPATAANVVNFGLTHNAHTNRLFWRVDEDCMIGRFYLMHPIAIHPETTDFVVSASWDYSFVPELCPSGNVATLVDSDDYLVVELQRRDYEWENLRPGPAAPAALARSLAEWTTEAHRRNVAQTVVFHAAERPANLAQVVAQADAFVASVHDALAAPPLAHRRHPYWVGSIAVNRQRAHRPLGKDDWSFLLGDRPIQPSPLKQCLRRAFFGFPPGVTGLHPLWPDYKPPLEALQPILSANGHVLLVAPDCEPFAPWIAGASGDVATLNADHLLQLTRAQYDGLAGTFDACLLLAGETMLEQSEELIEHIAPLVKPKGRIILLAVNSIAAQDAADFGRNFVTQAGRLLSRTVRLEDIRYVALSPWRLAVRKALTRAVSQTGAARILALTAPPLALVNYFANMAAGVGAVPPRGAWSSVCVTLRTSDQPAPYPERLAAEAAAPERSRSAGPAIPAVLTTPALQANPLWQESPAQLASHLAHYRFVAGLMGVRHDVAEYGCSSPAGTQLMLQQFRKVTLFDPRPVVVDDLQWRFRDRWRFDAKCHDILAEPLPRQADSIYCIDFIQYISRDEEETFVKNLRDSLAHDFDFLVLGSPSYGAHGARLAQPATPDATEPAMARLEPQNAHCRAAGQHAGSADGLSEAAAPEFATERAGIYRRAGAELQALMARFFQTVFIFSVIDDTAQSGIHANAQHIFALGCGKKD